MFNRLNRMKEKRDASISFLSSHAKIIFISTLFLLLSNNILHALNITTQQDPPNDSKDSLISHHTTTEAIDIANTKSLTAETGYYNGLFFRIAGVNSLWSPTSVALSTELQVGFSSNFNDIGTATGWQLNSKDRSIDWFGYFRPGITGTYNFRLVNVDDEAYLWLGQKALAGFNNNNFQLRKELGTSAFYSPYLYAGVYYPIRMHYSDNGGSRRISLQVTGPTGSWWEYLSCANGFIASVDGCRATLPYTTSGLNVRVINGCSACSTNLRYLDERPTAINDFVKSFASIGPATKWIYDGQLKAADWRGYIMVPPFMEGWWSFTFQCANWQAYLWFGNKALSGYTTANADLNGNGAVNRGRAGPFWVELKTGIYYPIRMYLANDGDKCFRLEMLEGGEGNNYVTYNDYLFTCTPGSYMSPSGCQPCEAGTYSTAHASTACSICPGNQYQDARGQTYCKLVPSCDSIDQYREYSSTTLLSCKAFSTSGTTNGLFYIVVTPCGNSECPVANGVSFDFSSIQTSSGNSITTNGKISSTWIGFLRIPGTSSSMWSIEFTTVDDDMYMWLGVNAVSGNTFTNYDYTLYRRGGSYSISLAGGVMYPIRLWYASYDSSGVSMSFGLRSQLPSSPLFNTFPATRPYLLTCAPGFGLIGTSCQICPAGSYKTLRGGSGCINCPEGSFCPVGAVTPTPCPLAYMCPNSYMATPIPCPAGSYANTLGLKQCISCSAGYFCPAIAAQQSVCAPNTFSESGSSVCSPCYIKNGPLPADIPVDGTFFEGGGIRSQCVCKIGYTGNFCQMRSCPNFLSGSSYMTLLYTSDVKLQKYSQDFNKTSSQISDAAQYLQTLLSVFVDMDGDGNVTIAEMKNALSYRSISTDNLVLPIWCQSAIRGSICYDTFQVEVDRIFTDSMRNFVISNEHTFDGSGIPIINSMSSTFPDPSWTSATCSRFDQSLPNRTPDNQVNTTWRVVDRSKVKRVCGYTNGKVDAAFNIESVTTGKQDFFVDLTLNRNVMSKSKRIYCISVEYINSLNVFDLGYECSVGLFYDGSPIDLNPILNEWGVSFSYLDTSVSEKQFDIFVGDFGSAETDKQLIVGIPYASEGCGRVSNHISYLDTQSRKRVGQIREYGVRAVYANLTSGMSIMPYRVPFLVQVGGSVTTLSSQGVENVIVKYCRIDPVTGVNSEDPNFCPLKTFVTDQFGSWFGEVRVSSFKWTNLVEYFNITVELTEKIQDGIEIVHEFSPRSMIAAIKSRCWSIKCSFSR